MKRKQTAVLLMAIITLTACSAVAAAAPMRRCSQQIACTPCALDKVVPVQPLRFVMSIVGEDGKMSFRTINFEVASMCNGRCNYCVTGAKNANPGGIMQADTFDATLRNLERLNLIDSRSALELYNWGEPFLHPDLQNIIRIINDLVFAVRSARTHL